MFSRFNLTLQVASTHTQTDQPDTEQPTAFQLQHSPVLFPLNSRTKPRNRPIDTVVKDRLHHLDSVFPPDPTSARLTAQLFTLLRDADAAENLHSVTPQDILAYLVSRDAMSNTIVHAPTCPAWNRPMSCQCPQRAKYDSLKTTVGRLRGLFRDNGMPLPWETGTRLANPANSVLVHHYLKQTALEQRSANVHTRKAALIDDSIYHLIQTTLLKRWASNTQTGNKLDALHDIRLTFLCAILWHSGLRLEDALRLLVQQIRPLSRSRQLLLQINVTKAERESQPYRTLLIDNDQTAYHPHRLFTILRDAYLGYGVDLQVDRLFTNLILDAEGACTGTRVCQARHLRAAFRSLCDSLDLDPTVSFHSFHGSRALRDAIAGIPPEVTCANIHWSIDMYNRYVKGRLPITETNRRTTAPQPARPAHRRRANIYGWEDDLSE